jgi:hypothetical protein
VIVFRALYLGGYDIVKDHYELEHASRTVRFLAAQVQNVDELILSDFLLLRVFSVLDDLLSLAGFIAELHYYKSTISDRLFL